jgi:hypothetical protein
VNWGALLLAVVFGLAFCVSLIVRFLSGQSVETTLVEDALACFFETAGFERSMWIVNL